MIFWKCDGCGTDIPDETRSGITLKDRHALKNNLGYLGEHVQYADLCLRCVAAVQDIVPSLTPTKEQS